MLTARNRPEDVLKGFAAGADDYLPKPFDLSILLARLQGLLRRSQWMRGHPSANPDAPDSLRTSPPNNADDFGTFSFDGKTIDFGTLELRTAGQRYPPHSDGVGTAAAHGTQRWASGFAQADSGRSVGLARRH